MDPYASLCFEFAETSCFSIIGDLQGAVILWTQGLNAGFRLAWES